MKLESVGILISLRPFGERDAVAHIFSYDYGIMVGVMKGAQIAKKNRPLIGQVGSLSWNARLDSQLGAFHWEAEKNMAAVLMTMPDALAMMNSAFDLIDALLPERERYETLYDETIQLIKNLGTTGALQSYIDWEVVLLRELGYALNLSCCSGCGTKKNLEFLSPKTGRAVCKTCAEPYINKVYKLPINLNITQKFLEKVCDDQGVLLPVSRKFLNKKY